MSKMCKGLCESICKDCKYLNKTTKKVVHRPTSSSLVRLDTVQYTCEQSFFKNKKPEEVTRKRCKTKKVKE